MRTIRIAAVFVVAGCAAVDVPPEETPYFREQSALAHAAPKADAPGDEAKGLRESASKLELRGAAESERIRRADETEGLLDVESPAAKEFLARIADAKTSDAVLATTPLDLEKAMLAAYALNPDVAAARANWSATVRMYDQATYLEDLLLRYGAFTRLATPRVGAAPMREAAFPYPGVDAWRGEMIDREVAMARETTRMKLRDAIVATSKAWHVAVHHGEELRLRDEQLSLVKRAAETTRALVASGKSPQAELLEMESDIATAQNDREHAVASLARARAEQNTLLGRDPQATLVLPEHFHDVPADDASPVEPLLALARQFSPEIRMARAEAARADAAIRMSEAMLFAPRAPGAVATTDAMDEPPSAAPAASVADFAWIAEMKERRVALERAADEAVRATERRVLEAHDEMEAMRRMYVVAAKSAEPLSAQAVEERLRLYESGRAEFAALVASLRRHLDAAHDAVAARHDYFMQQAKLWMAIGARPELVRDGGKR